MSRVALVSGGGRGIGRSICLRLAQSGCDLAINYRRDEDAAREVQFEVERLGQRAMIVQASVDRWDDDSVMVQSVVRELGRPSILVHNAGVVSMGSPLVETPLEEFDRVMRTHAYGGYFLAKLCVPYMCGQPRGDIIVISSVEVEDLGPNRGPYAMAKSALEAMAITLSKELQGDNVRVNIVAPGLVSTEMGDRFARAMSSGKLADASDLDGISPFGRVCRPEDVAALVDFLVSEPGGYISGARIRLHGGGGIT